MFSLLVFLFSLYLVPVALALWAATFLLRASPARIAGVERSVFLAPVLVWGLFVGLVPHWSGKSLSNLIEILILGVLVAVITLARGYLGRAFPAWNHARWYVPAILLAPILVWLAVPALAE